MTFNTNFDDNLATFNVGFSDTQIINSGAYPIASSDALGVIKVGNNLTITEDGVLSVDTIGVIEEDNTKPVTSGAVYMEIGNIEVLLGAI